jgi:hypothetical protein
MYSKKNSRGLERIRTAVEAFAELCLATRPQDHLYVIEWVAKVMPFCLKSKEIWKYLCRVYIDFSKKMIYKTDNQVITE